MTKDQSRDVAEKLDTVVQLLEEVFREFSGNFPGMNALSRCLGMVTAVRDFYRHAAGTGPS